VISLKSLYPEILDMPQHNAAIALVNGFGIAFENVEYFLEHLETANEVLGRK